MGDSDVVLKLPKIEKLSAGCLLDMPILFYGRIASMHSPLTRRHQFANKNINNVISITSWADATHESDAMYYKTSLDTIFIKSIDKIRLLKYT